MAEPSSESDPSASTETASHDASSLQSKPLITQEQESRPDEHENPAPIGSIFSLGDMTQSWFASDPSKAYYEKLSLIWAPTSMFLLLVGLLGTQLYKYCDRNSYLVITIVGCLPGLLIPLLFPCEADLDRPLLQRFWVKGTLWIAIFGFYGNYFWTHYFYTLLGAEYKFDSYRFNDVPLVTFTCTFFYFSFYFNFVTIILRRIAASTADFPPFGRSLVWWTSIFALSYGTACFEALTIRHFPLYTYTERDTFLIIGSIVYGLYFIVGFPMFFSLDERVNGSTDSDAHDNKIGTPTHSLSDTIVNALAATAIVTLLLDLWRLFLGSIYILGTAARTEVPFVYGQPTSTTSPILSTPPPQTIYIQDPVTVDACVQLAKGWARRKLQSITEVVGARI